MEFLVKYITCHFINIGGCLQSITVFSLLNNTDTTDLGLNEVYEYTYTKLTMPSGQEA